MQHNTDLRPACTQMTFAGKTYDVMFNISVVDAICEQFDCAANDIINLINDTKGKEFRKNVVAITVTLINEAVDIHNEDYPDDQWKPITEKQIKRSLNPVAFADLYDQLVKCYIDGFVRKKTTDEDDIGEDPNPGSGAA